MPKKNIPVPSDFARPKKGVYVKKGELARPKKETKYPEPKKSVAPKKKYEGRDHNKTKGPDTYTPKGAMTFKPREPKVVPKTDEKMPLNKYIAHAGICSRRDAIELIKNGQVKVNGIVLKEPGYKIVESDKVMLDDKLLTPQQKMVYFLLNKPKNFITTTDDPEGRKTVLDLLKPITDARVFPVGRLDRNTTGLLLLTNDGDLAQKLSHPSHETRKIYHVVLDRNLSMKDFESIAEGLLLEDGVAAVDEVAFITPGDKKEIGIEIHSGRNRIVRRIFEHLKYEVKSLDRVVYAGLTKKNLPRGKVRELDEKEVIYLKHFNQSKNPKAHAIKTT
ncbi:MAG: rRNA pseudouridine synthase [Bacteroidetes bacterium]|nr:rRNA pseudouridine synthase [Bacteroidota bacterium]